MGKGPRWVRALALGGLLTLTAWIFGSTADGMLGAVGFLLAPFLAAVTIGLTIAELAAAAATRPSVGRCSSCRGQMAEVGDIRMCAVCDRAPLAA